MDAFIIYIIKCTLCFTVFYICVKAFLSNETFFRFNRWVILIGSAVCLLLPLIQIKVSTEEISTFQAPIMVLERTLTETVIEPNPDTLVQANDSEPIKTGTIILGIYIIGIIINLIILLRSIFLMTNLIRQGKKQFHPDYTLVLISGNTVPFSWGKYIVLSTSDYENNPDEIITHEMAHTKHRHSIDLIFIEFILLFQWFNPAIWLLKKELKDIHEYQADLSVLQSGIDATKYQLLLVKKAVGTSSYTLANSFKHSKIKKRITMMLKVRSKKRARMKLLLLLPLGALTMFAFAPRPEMNEPLSSLVEYESTNILSEIKTAEKEIVLQEPETKQQKKIKPNHYKFYSYLIDGEKVTKEEYEVIEKNSVEIVIPEYIPFAKGKVIEIVGVSNTGEKDSHTYIREMFIDGKAPDRSHVHFILNDIKFSFEGGVVKAKKAKFTTLEEAQKYTKNPVKGQIVSKDGSQSSPVFYIAMLVPLTIPADKVSQPPVKATKQKEKKEGKDEKVVITVTEAPPTEKQDDKIVITVSDVPSSEKKEKRDTISRQETASIQNKSALSFGIGDRIGSN